MTDTTIPPDITEGAPAGASELSAVQEWLSTPLAEPADDALQLLHDHLTTLRNSSATDLERAELLDRLYTRSSTIIGHLIVSLQDVALPVPRATRELVHSLQGLLEALIDDRLVVTDTLVESERNLSAWRNIKSLAQHLLIGDLVAAPAGAGIWGQLHHTYATARKANFADYTPDGETNSLQHIYLSALLMGCAQPDSFTSREIAFIAGYLQLFAHRVDAPSEFALESASAFWVDLKRDSPAFPCARKTAPPETSIRYFSCEPIAALLNHQLDALNAGHTASQTELPDFAATPAGRGVLNRLAVYWGTPGKRKFPHRRRNHRAEVCTGLSSVWQLFHHETTTPPDVSSWMITNQSPDGYAIMHLGGTTGNLAVGDVTAIRSESEAAWQICLVRWALSENQEHLEMGLQILAPRAVPATLTLRSAVTGLAQLPVLLLPDAPPLRSAESLVVPSGALDGAERKLVLMMDQDKISVREMCATHIEEQTSSVEVFVIEPDNAP